MIHFFWQQSKRGWMAWILMGVVTAWLPARAENRLIGDAHDGSQSPPVHHLDLYTFDGFRIFPGVNDQEPFSQRLTCGKCHDVTMIESGWHFSAGQDNGPPGRPGEPWVFWDCATATQIPLSYRPWPGTYEPNQVGLSAWEFIQVFGRHLPGGGIGRPAEEQATDPGDRWKLSGPLEVQCLNCHNTSFSQDLSQVADQIGKQNYRWVGSAACDFAWVQGQVRNLPDSWQSGSSLQTGPSVTYDASRFSPSQQVTVDIRRDIPNERCLFCHSNHLVGVDEQTDVHLSAGMRCVDCHRNGLDHLMVRGYESEAADTNDPDRITLTCRGCHLGSTTSAFPTAGELTAPYPQHRGLPPIHLEKLSCTACHSGPWPRTETVGVKTTRAHSLGTHQANRSDETLPHIQMPVFAPGVDGKLTPHKLIWPSFWAQQRGEAVVPFDFSLAQTACKKVLMPKVALESSSWPVLSLGQVIQVLQALQRMQPGLQPAYVSGGKLYRLQGSDLQVIDHPAARPTLWPLAHNVRPAQQALGVRQCQDCHAADAAMIFGQVKVDGPLVDPNTTVPMAAFDGLDSTQAQLLTQAFVFRPMLKTVCLLACLVIGAVLLIYGLRAIGWLAVNLGRHRSEP